LIRLRQEAPTTGSWLKLEQGVEVLVRPYTSAELYSIYALHAGKPEHEQKVLHIAEIAAVSVMDWRGVMGEDGEPLPFTPDYVRMLILYHPDQANSFWLASSQLMTGFEQEKKVSANGHAGTTAEAPSTAKAARPSSSRVPRGRRARTAGSALM
jgi:hypothetical protein